MAVREATESKVGGAVPFQVKVGQAGHSTKLIEVNPGETAATIIKRAGFDVTGKDIRAGTEKVSADHVVQPGEMIMVSPRVEAGGDR